MVLSVHHAVSCKGVPEQVRGCPVEKEATRTSFAEYPLFILPEAREVRDAEVAGLIVAEVLSASTRDVRKKTRGVVAARTTRGSGRREVEGGGTASCFPTEKVDLANTRGANTKTCERSRPPFSLVTSVPFPESA